MEDEAQYGPEDRKPCDKDVRVTFLQIAHFLYLTSSYTGTRLKIERVYMITRELIGTSPFPNTSAFRRAFYRMK